MKSRTNAGFSLIELIVVVAIMAVLTVSGVVGFGLLSGRDAKDGADKAESLFDSHKTVAMGKVDSYACFYVDTDGNTYFEEYVLDFDNGVISSPVLSRRELVAKKGVIVKYTMTTDAPGVSHDLGNASLPLIISYDRGTGQFKDLSLMNSGLTGVYLKSLSFSKANITRMIKISYLTGKVIQATD